VIDATAGFGGDAFQLACLGCKVLAVERVSIVAELLQDGVARGLQADDGRLRGILARLTVVEADSRALLSALSEDDRPDVVYLDPMYPARTKSALGKKSFRILRDLVGEDPDASELLAAALAAARRRVVVKRLRHAPPLAERPALQVPGTRVRYDVYLTRLIASAAGN
jgi:16S rRNA (guanine1516-N2)-methyltransferase